MLRLDTAIEECKRIKKRYYKDEDKPFRIWFRTIRENLTPNTILLDAGCGHNMESLKLLADKCNFNMGVGVDMKIDISNALPNSIYGIYGNLELLPFKQKSIDLIISHSVFEHLENPKIVFHEFYRILKNKGRIIFLTPNKYDYVSLFSIFLPYKFQKRFVKAVLKRPEEDIFPTFYRANTISAIKKIINISGFNPIKLSTLSDYPKYLMFSPIIFRLGILYSKIIAKYDFLSFLRPWIIGVLEKKD